MKKAFTLIELLVVVLIIGILAAIALPQYQVAVEKSRASEAFLTIKSMREAAQRVVLARGTSEGGYYHVPDYWDISFDQGMWNEDKSIYWTKHFIYVLDDGSVVDVYRCKGNCTGPNYDEYEYNLYESYPFILCNGIPCADNDVMYCDGQTELGTKVCKALGLN